MAEIQPVKVGSVTVPIYELKNRGNKLFCVSYYSAGQRIRKNFSSLSKAKEEASKAARNIHTGEQMALKLTDSDRASYIAALEALQPLGKRLEAACAEYADAMKILNGRGGLSAAVQFYAKHHLREMPKIKIPDLVKEMLEAKKADGVSELHLKDLRLRLERFAGVFQTYIASVTTEDMDDWLRRLNVGARTRKNYRNTLLNFFHFARLRGYLPKNQATEADGLTQTRVKGKEVEIFMAEEMANLLKYADSGILPFLAIGAFAGLRHWELLRLYWEDINFSEGHILVRAEKAKTAQRRIIPISENLAQWLQPFRGCTGRIVSHDDMSRQLTNLCKVVRKKTEKQFSWVKNGLRHSYGSYRLALIKNAAQVALEMGNSPQMVFRHYREVVTEKEAKHWFSIQPPDKVKNVIPIKQDAA